MEIQDRKLTILYASQSGTAQDIAEKIWRESRRRHYSGPVKPLNDYPVTNFLYDNVIVFVVSTTGQGEEPDNMKAFWRVLLRKSLPNNSMNHLRFAVLGLGDSSYFKYNFVAKRLHKRMLQLGAFSLLPISLADDQHEMGIDATIGPFLTQLWAHLLQLLPLPDCLSTLEMAPDQLQCRWQVEEVELSKDQIWPLSVYHKDIDPNVIEVKVQKNSRTTDQNHFQDVRHIVFGTKGITYEPGDVLMIRPKNSDDQVQAFFTVLRDNNVKLNPKIRVQLSQRDRDMPIPIELQRVLTLEQICKEYWDLSAIPRRYTFDILAAITPSPLEKDKCRDFTTPEGQYDLYSYCNRPRRNIVEVLQDFPHATSQLNLDMLFEMLHPIRPRAFSIASSSKAHENEIHILVAVVKYHTQLKLPRLGLCSNWLAKLQKCDEVAVWIKKGTFKFPEDPEIPMIMVGPGTGVAPFRSFISERVHLNKAIYDKLVLFFGCRNKEGDFHFQNEFNTLRDDGKLRIICAFSRDEDHKVYVQHKILQNAKMVWNAVNNNQGQIFVAGNSKNMPTGVKDAFIKIWQDCSEMTLEEATEFIDQLQKEGRYQCETWN